jgi:hypothetical protein
MGRARSRRSALAASRRSSSIEARISGIFVHRKAAGLLNESRPRALPPAHDPDRRRRSQHLHNRAGDDEPQCPVRPVPSSSDRCGSVAGSPTDADRGGSSGLAARSSGGALDADAAVGISLPMDVYEHAVGVKQGGPAGAEAVVDDVWLASGMARMARHMVRSHRSRAGPPPSRPVRLEQTRELDVTLSAPTQTRVTTRGVTGATRPLGTRS